jgi:hypothetical protein
MNEVDLIQVGSFGLSGGVSTQTSFADISAALQLTYEQARVFKLLYALPVVTLAIMEERIGKTPEAARILIHRLRLKLSDHKIKVVSLYNGGYYLQPDDRQRACEIIERFRLSTQLIGS